MRLSEHARRRLTLMQRVRDLQVLHRTLTPTQVRLLRHAAFTAYRDLHAEGLAIENDIARARS